MGDNKDVTLDVYTNSTIIKKTFKKILSHFRLAFLDIDFTLSANTSRLPYMRKRFEQLDYGIVFVTARTEEMVMSKKAYKKSLKHGFSRPEPHIKKRNGEYYYIDPKKINPDLVDPDIIIGSTGTEIYIKQLSGAYLCDTSFRQKHTKISSIWRDMVMEILFEIDPQQEHLHLSKIEYAENYLNHTTDIFPPQFRIQMFFDTVSEKSWFLKELNKRNLLHTMFYRKSSSLFRVIDDSNEENNKIAMYITPPRGSKSSAVEHVVNQLERTMKNLDPLFSKAHMETILAGDSYPDLSMLLHGALGTESTALLVGGSRISKVLTDNTSHVYVGEDFLPVKELLEPQKTKGKYHYRVPVDIYEKGCVREFIIGDDAYPKTIGPETIIAHLSAMYSVEKKDTKQ